MARRGTGLLARLALVPALSALTVSQFGAFDRGEATTGPARLRAAHMLLEIGRRMGESPLRLDDMLGVRLERWAAQALRDERAQARADAALRRLEESEPERAPGWSWPLDALDDDLGPLR